MPRLVNDYRFSFQNSQDFLVLLVSREIALIDCWLNLIWDIASYSVFCILPSFIVKQFVSRKSRGISKYKYQIEQNIYKYSH